MLFPLCYVLFDNGVGVILVEVENGIISRLLKELKVSVPTFDFDVKVNEDGQYDLTLFFTTRSVSIVLGLSEKIVNHLIEKQNLFLYFCEKESNFAEQYVSFQLDRDLLIRIDAVVRYAQKRGIQLSKEDVVESFTK